MKNDFLFGELDQEIYIKQTRGFESQTQGNYVWQLRKILYGIKQALRACYGKIVELLIQGGDSECQSEDINRTSH